MAYVQAKAGHSQSSITDRYIHAAHVGFPGAVAKTETRMFGAGAEEAGVAKRVAKRASRVF
jgi:hypothetical protein